MRFKINLPAGIDLGTLCAAGLDPEGFTDLDVAVITGKATLPKELRCVYLPDLSVKCALTVHRFGERENIERWRDKSGKLVFKRSAKAKYGTHIEIEIDDDRVGRAVKKHLDRYSFENDGEILSWREHCDTWNRIDAVLKRDKLSYDKLQAGKGPLPRRAIEGLIKLTEEIDPHSRDNVHGLFDERSVAKSDRPFVAKWLIEEFERSWYADDQLGVNIWNMACKEIADDLIRLIRDRRYGDERWPLALALAKTKHPRAADVIVTLLGQGVNTRGAIEALGRLPAQKHIERIRKYLRDPDSDVRREAKRTLKKLGAAVETPPPPVHLVKSRKLVPKGLEEWSTNLDMDDLATTLEKLSKCFDKGFDKAEIAEVLGVAEEMPPERTKVFRFPVVAGKKSSDVWIVIFMDDIDAPDIEIHADLMVIQKLEQLTARE